MSGGASPVNAVGSFAKTTRRYLATIAPAVARELSHWRGRAERIPDARLRGLAREALRKRGNMYGAALFAVLAPRERAAETVRALVAFQAAYNYLDLLAEQPSDEPVRNGRRLHEALLVALDPDAPHRDYYASHPRRADRGYLVELVEASRGPLRTLPSYACVGDSALLAASRIVGFQSLNLGERQGGRDGLERWARATAPSGMRWWEGAAACGSSLIVHALIALASRERLRADEVDAVARAYHPWIGALHSLLDSLVDVEEDRREGQRNLLAGYPSRATAGARMCELAGRARLNAAALGDDGRHASILVAMTCHYLSAAGARTRDVRAVAGAVRAGSDPLVGRVLPIFAAARVASRAVRAAG